MRDNWPDSACEVVNTLRAELAKLRAHLQAVTNQRDAYIAAGPPGTVGEVRDLTYRLQMQTAALLLARQALALYAMPSSSQPGAEIPAARAMQLTNNPDACLRRRDAEIRKAAEIEAARVLAEKLGCL